jgi:hypothetical protein
MKNISIFEKILYDLTMVDTTKEFKLSTEAMYKS